MNILITSAGRRVSLVQAFKRELKKVFPKSKVMVTDAAPQLSAASQAADESFIIPRVNHPDYISILIDICVANNVKLVIPTIDHELLLLANNEKILNDHGIYPIISSVKFVKICRDKRFTHEFFNSKGIEVAKEYTKENYEFPMYIKPYDGSRSVDNYVVKAQDELKSYHFENDKLMFLEYLNRDLYDEYTCDLYYDKKGILKCAVPRKRIEVRDGEVSKGLTVHNELVPFIKKNLATIEGAKGCLTTQFFMHKKNYGIKGIEINPRFGGGFPLTYAAGANYPNWIIREYLLDEQIEDGFSSWEPNLLMLRYDAEIFLHVYQG